MIFAAIIFDHLCFELEQVHFVAVTYFGMAKIICPSRVVLSLKRSEIDFQDLAGLGLNSLVNKIMHWLSVFLEF